MAITPHQVDSVTLSNAVDALEKRIDDAVREAMADGGQVSRVDADLSRSYTVFVSGSVSRPAMDMLRERYQASGWNDVVISNSADSGERPGLMSVKLTALNSDAPSVSFQSTPDERRKDHVQRENYARNAGNTSDTPH